MSKISCLLDGRIKIYYFHRRESRMGRRIIIIECGSGPDEIFHKIVKELEELSRCQEMMTGQVLLLASSYYYTDMDQYTPR